MMLRADFFTRQFVHSSLTRRKIRKVIAALQREETGLKYSDYTVMTKGPLRSRHRVQRFAPCPRSFSLATHNLSWQGHLWVLPAGLWSLDREGTAIHSAVSHSAALNAIMCNCSNARRETSILYSTLKGNKPRKAGHWRCELRITGKIQMQELDLKKGGGEGINQ